MAPNFSFFWLLALQLNKVRRLSDAPCHLAFLEHIYFQRSTLTAIPRTARVTHSSQAVQSIWPMKRRMALKFPLAVCPQSSYTDWSKPMVGLGLYCSLGLGVPRPKSNPTPLGGHHSGRIGQVLDGTDLSRKTFSQNFFWVCVSKISHQIFGPNFRTYPLYPRRSLSPECRTPATGMPKLLCCELYFGWDLNHEEYEAYSIFHRESPLRCWLYRLKMKMIRKSMPLLDMQ